MIVELDLPKLITAIGGLGTAAAGLVDATKVCGGGVNRIGFKTIRKTVTPLAPDPSGTVTGLSQEKLLATLQANWFNGTDLASQKAIAKSLIKLHLVPDNAETVARAAGADSTALKAITDSIAAGTALTPPQTDFFARFDLTVTALLDEAYQRADQIYRNSTRAWAVVASVLLAMGGAWMLQGGLPKGDSLGEALLIGLLATPLAPIAKDLSTALGTAVNALQQAKK